jgi:hypothetical protein
MCVEQIIMDIIFLVNLIKIPILAFLVMEVLDLLKQIMSNVPLTFKDKS